MHRNHLGHGELSTPARGIQRNQLEGPRLALLEHIASTSRPSTPEAGQGHVAEDVFDQCHRTVGGERDHGPLKFRAHRMFARKSYEREWIIHRIGSRFCLLPFPALLLLRLPRSECLLGGLGNGLLDASAGSLLFGRSGRLGRSRAAPLRLGGLGWLRLFTFARCPLFDVTCFGLAGPASPAAGRRRGERPPYRSAWREDPAHARHRSAPDEPILVEEPGM